MEIQAHYFIYKSEKMMELSDQMRKMTSEEMKKF